jgi:membrane protease YdiL (CAAX protease family)
VSAAIILVVAVVLGVVYEYTNNIVVPALVHGLYNATLISLAYLALVA